MILASNFIYDATIYGINSVHNNLLRKKKNRAMTDINGKKEKQPILFVATIYFLRFAII